MLGCCVWVVWCKVLDYLILHFIEYWEKDTRLFISKKTLDDWFWFGTLSLPGLSSLSCPTALLHRECSCSCGPRGLWAFWLCHPPWDLGSLILSTLDARARHFYHLCDPSLTDCLKLYCSLKSSNNDLWDGKEGHGPSGVESLFCTCSCIRVLLLSLKRSWKRRKAFFLV